MEKSITVFVASGRHYADYVSPLAHVAKVKIVDSPEDADILWFAGGEDVNPAIYNAPVHPRTHFSVARSYQEDQLIKLFPEKFKVGTCRGHQQFHASSGGILIQHTDRHAGGGHAVMDVRTGEVIGSVTSAHHQAVLRTDGVEMEVLLTTPEIRATTQQIGAENGQGYTEVEIKEEIEAAWWPKINAFGIQGHPEWMSPSEPVFQWFVNELLTRFEQHQLKFSKK